MTLDQLGSVSRGRSRHRPRDAEFLYGGSYPFVQTGDVKKAGLYLRDFEQTYSEAGLAQSKLWPVGTLCITIAANIAETSILDIEACFPDSVIGFIAEPEKADARFVKYLFDAALKMRFQSFTQGAAHGQKPLPWRHWLKWVIVADLDQQFLLSQSARRGPWNDCGNLPAMVEAASQQTRIGVVLADAEFDSERNHTYIRRQLGAQSVIPAKRGKKTWRVRGVRAEMRRAFPRQLYRRRALIETVFSSVKRKLSARAPGRSLRMQTRQALLLGLSFNLYRLRHRYLFLRMSTEPHRSLLPGQRHRLHR